MLHDCQRPASKQWLIVFCVALCLCRQSAALPIRYSDLRFPAQSATDTLYVLPVPWVIDDSVVVRTTHKLLVEYDDYRLLEPGNRLWLFRPLLSGDTLFVHLAYEPIPLYNLYLRRTVRDVRESAADTAATKRVVLSTERDERTTSWSRLNKSGSLIRSVQVGTDQDLQLESALNLTVVGRIGTNVDVTAALSDQSTPIQPEGTTENINELDKVYVAVSSPRFDATLGDHTVQMQPSEFASYERKLTGVRAGYHDSTIAVNAGGASSRGEFFSNEFLGQDANQGPYPLRDRNGATGVVVLAGTERVWLDGTLLRRGENNDYVMDYAAGTLTFTVRHVIHSATRIVVDFQYSSEDFERLFLNGQANAQFETGALSGAITFLSEMDDRQRPQGAAFSEEERALLRAAGDRADSAAITTADSLGPGLGDYVAADTLQNGVNYRYFRFTPRDSLNRSTGSWSVSFDDFGDGRGDYRATASSLGLVYFEWVGPGAGRYRAARRLPLPQAHDLSDVRVATNLLPGLRLAGEGVISRRDLNALSTLDDADNDGRAGVLTMSWRRDKPQWAGVRLHSVDLQAKVRARDAAFAEINRSPEIEFGRDWDLARNTGRAETIRELHAAVAPSARVRVDGDYADLDRGKLASSVRRSAGMSITFPVSWRTWANVTGISSADSAAARSGQWWRQRGGSEGQIGRFSPRVLISREQKEDQFRDRALGVRFVEWLSGSGVRLSDEWNVDAAILRRQDDVLDSVDYVTSARATEVQGSGRWNRAATGSAEFQFAHREKSFAAIDSTPVKTDAAKLDLLLAPDPGWLEGSLTYQVSKSQAVNQVLVAVQVTPGTGNYRKVGEQYVPDDQGDFLLVPRSTGSYQPASDLAFTSEFALKFDEIKRGRVPNWLRLLSAETEVTLDEKTRLPLDGRLVLLDPARLRGDSTLTGSVQFRQDVGVLRLNRKVQVRARYRNQRALQNQFLNGGQTRVFDEYSVRVRGRYWETVRGETNVETSKETLGYSSGVIANRDVRRTRFSEDLTYSLSQRWEFGAEFGAEEARDERSSTQASLRDVRPHITLTVAGKGRFDGDLGFAHATSNRAVLPFEVGRGSNRGNNWRWSLRGTYALGQSLSGSISYSARKDASEPVFQSGRVEVRASL